MSAVRARGAVVALACLACLAAVLVGRPAAAGADGTLPVKAAIAGLVDRQGPPQPAMLPYVHAYVVKVNWADLQPEPFGPISADNAIDHAIARVRQPDFAAVGMVLKLRVFAGVGAPDWAKRIGGDPIPYLNDQVSSSLPGGTIGRFWTPEYAAAYADLESKLAARYDDVPELREVTVAQCSTIYDELFVRQVGIAQNVSALLAAGYTVDADKACIASAFQAHTVWHRTRSDVAFNPFPLVTNPTGPRDLAFTLSMMTLCRQILTTRCGLQNNSLSSTKLKDTQFKTMYQSMSQRGPTIVFQTATADQIGTPKAVLSAAVNLGANSVELPAGYRTWPTTLLQTTAAGLAANPVS